MLEEGEVRLLVVDDQESNLYLVREIFDGYPIQLTCADSAKKALIVLKENPNFDLILLDIQMPNVDGFELAKFIKEDLDLASIPIIFLTAVHQEPEYILKGLNIGAVDYLTKPIHPNVLLKKVEMVLVSQKEKNDSDETKLRYRSFIKRMPSL
jgi:CheY-like chemotaxis protein